MVVPPLVLSDLRLALMKINGTLMKNIIRELMHKMSTAHNR
jgi:hypothetical protein